METIFLFFNNNLSAFSVIEIDALDDARICCSCTAILTKGRARLVKKPAIQKPGKVEQARLRIEAAIKRLEAALTARDESTDDVARAMLVSLVAGRNLYEGRQQLCGV